MVKIENDCCDCATETYPCLGNNCSLIEAKHYYCDLCGDETDIYYFDNGEYCIKCIESMLESVK